MLAAVLACGPGAVLSHRSALVLWGVCPGSPSAFDVTTPTRRGRADPRIRAHRSGDLPAAELTLRRAIPVTDVARSLIDFAATAGSRELQRAVDEAAFLGLLRRSDLAARLRDRPPRRGSRRLRRAVDPGRPASRTRSGLEERFLALLRAAGVEAPLVNRRISTLEGSFEVDFCWPGRGLIVETDGFRAHGGERRFHSDRERDQCLGAAGWRVHRFTPAQVFERPKETVRRVAALLVSAAAPR